MNESLQSGTLPRGAGVLSEIAAPKRGRGRPHKGPRDQVKGDVPLSLAQRFRNDAARLGKSHADYLAEVLASFYRHQDGEGAAA